MAEIHVERKERTAWPWILLGLILLALLVWWLMTRADRDLLTTQQDTTQGVVDTAAGTVGEITAPSGAPAAVVAFVAFANENRSRQAMDTTHELTADGIRRLARALNAVASRQPGLEDTVRQHLDSMATLADELQQNRQAADHADYARRAFLQASMAMQQLQERAFAGAANQVQQVREAAEAVQGNRPLLEQRTQVQRFFDRSAEALGQMSAAQG